MYVCICICVCVCVCVCVGPGNGLRGGPTMGGRGREGGGGGRAQPVQDRVPLKARRDSKRHGSRGGSVAARHARRAPRRRRPPGDSRVWYSVV